MIPDSQPDSNRFVAGLQRNYLRTRDDVCALACRHARVRVNQFFGRNDTGRRHVQRRDAGDMWLAGANFGRAEQAQALDAVVLTAFLQRGKFRLLVRIAGHDEFTGVAEGDVVLGAEIVRKAVARDAVARFE